MQSNDQVQIADTQLNALIREQSRLDWLKPILCVSRNVIVDIQYRTARRLDRTNSRRLIE